VRELLSEKALARAGIFAAHAVERLTNKLTRSGDRAIAARDDMAFVGILSTQLLHHHFIDNFAARIAEAREASSRLNMRVSATHDKTLVGEHQITGKGVSE
jgi:asparagine synthase (glutamine-hydrolysing)